MVRKRASNNPPTQRQQRVSEEIRHVISSILQRGEIWNDVLQKSSVTISQVKVSIDIKHAFIFIMPLGGENIEEILSALKENSKIIRALLAKNIYLKSVPQLHFHIDDTFENVDKIERLLSNPHVAQDLERKTA